MSKATAMQKINQELLDKNNHDPGIAAVAQYLYRVIGDDEGFAEDVMDEEHSIFGCWEYIKDKARANAKGGVFVDAGEDDSKSKVFEWAEDYYRSPVPEKPAPKTVAKKTKPITVPKTDEGVSLFDVDEQMGLFDL